MRNWAIQPDYPFTPAEADARGSGRGRQGHHHGANLMATYPCYWLKKDKGGEWYWVYYASNGKAISRSSESYVKRADCEHSIDIMKSSSSSPVHTD